MEVEEDWQLKVRCFPFGPSLAFKVDAGMRPKKRDILHAYNVALLEAPSSERFDLHSLLDTPVNSKLAPSRLFFCDNSDDEVVWREIHGKDSITYDMEELCLANTTPPASPPASPERSDGHHKTLAAIYAYLISKPNVWRVLLFGSFLRNTATARDIDIAFESTEIQDPSMVVGWAEELTVLIGMEVDLVDLSSSYHNDMLAIRRGGLYISPAGTLFEDRIFVENVEVLGRCFFAMQTLREQLLLRLQLPTCDSFGIAKRLEGFYQLWENFSTRWLKIRSLPIPSGSSAHKGFVSLFTTPGNQDIPLMHEGVAVIIDDLWKFRHFSRKSYVEDYDLTIMGTKASQLLPVIDWAKNVLLSYTV